MKLVSDLKQFLILNDFSAIGGSTQATRTQYLKTQEETDKKVLSVRDEVSVVIAGLLSALTAGPVIGALLVCSALMSLAQPS